MISRKFRVLVVSVIVSIITLLIGAYSPSPSFSIVKHPLLAVSASLVILLTPYGYIDNLERKNTYEAERRIPDFLKDISEYTTFGMPMSEAITRISTNDYGPLSREVSRLSSRISFGIPVQEALKTFGDSLNSRTAARVSKILQKSSESGSNTSDVISMVSKFTSETQLLRLSRMTDMKNYTLIMLIAYGVFLFVILALDLQFLEKLQSAHLGYVAMSLQYASEYTIERVFTIGIMVQGIATGLIAGVMKDGRLSSGTFLSGIVLLVTIIILLAAGVLR